MSESKVDNKITDEQLLAAGFERRYDGSTPNGFIKTIGAFYMPYVREHMIDNEDIYEDTEVIVMTTADRMVEMVIPTSQNHSEEPVSMDTREGHGILRDAGVKLA